MYSGNYLIGFKGFEHSAHESSSDKQRPLRGATVPQAATVRVGFSPWKQLISECVDENKDEKHDNI